MITERHNQMNMVGHNAIAKELMLLPISKMNRIRNSTGNIISSQPMRSGRSPIKVFVKTFKVVPPLLRL
jgi:hypothetical protein